MKTHVYFAQACSWLLVVEDETLDNEVEDSEAGNTNTEEDKSENKRLY